MAYGNCMGAWVVTLEGGLTRAAEDGGPAHHERGGRV